MILRKIIIIALIVSIIPACNCEWDKHYKDVKGEMETSNLGVWEYLQTCSEYSDFVALLKRTKADTCFLIPQNYTIWAIKNEEMPDLSNLTDSMQGVAATNHITLVNYSVTGFKDGLSLQALSGKKLRMHADFGNDQGFLVNEGKVVKTVMTCKDGIIHEVDSWLSLQPTLLDYLEEADYSLLKEIVFSFRDTVFDKQNSVENGIDFEGNITYDSVFKIRYEFLDRADIGLDKAYFSMFLTPNYELDRELVSYFENIRTVTGLEPDEEDTTRIHTWVMKSFIHHGLVEDYGNKENLYSSYGQLWKTSYQKVNIGSRKEYSNGFVYEVTDLFIPNKFIQRPLDMPIAPIYDVKSDMLKLSVETSVLDESAYKLSTSLATPDGSSARYLKTQVELSSGPVEEIPEFYLTMEWETARLDTLGAYNPLYMTSGEYIVELTFVKTKDANVDFAVYVNDIYVNKIDMSKVLESNKLQTSVLGLVEIPVEIGVNANPLRIKLKSLTSNWKQSIAPFQISFRPTSNNY